MVTTPTTGLENSFNHSNTFIRAERFVLPSLTTKILLAANTAKRQLYAKPIITIEQYR